MADNEVREIILPCVLGDVYGNMRHCTLEVRGSVVLVGVSDDEAAPPLRLRVSEVTLLAARLMEALTRVQ